MSDLKFALCQLLKNRGFTALAVPTLEFGVGARRILDLRFAVCDWRAGRRDARGSHDGGRFAHFPEKALQPLSRQKASFEKQFYPIGRLGSLCLYDSGFEDELGARPAPAGGAVVGSDQSGASEELSAHHGTFRGSWQFANEPDRSRSEWFRTRFQWSVSHELYLGLDDSPVDIFPNRSSQN